MNYKICRRFLLRLKILLLCSFFFTYSNVSISEPLDNINNIYKNRFNEEILKGVLRGAGLSIEDAYLATQAFKLAYPPERLTDASYLILPFAEGKVDKFAVNIDGIDAVLITKKNKKFKTFITSTNYAHKLIEEGFENIIDNNNLLEIENYIKQEIRHTNNLVEDAITFNKGDTLLNFLYIPGAKRKEISNAIKAFSKYFDPSKIKSGTRGNILRTNEGKLIGFYLVLSNYKSVITYLSNTGYQAIKVPSKKVVNNFNETIDWYLKNNKVFNITKISLFNDPNLIKLNLKIKKGSNLFNTLKKASLDSMQIGNLLNNLKKIYNPKSIRPDQDIILAYKENSFYGLALEVNELKEVQIIKTPLGFEEYIYNKPVKKKYIFKEIVIESSLYEDSLKEGMPLEILIDMVRMFSFSVDFQRDIRKGNYFKVYYEFLLNYKGEKIMPGNIIYANAKLKNNILDMFRFNSQNGKHEYFNSNGESIRKTLMKTPIDGARLSSRFGKRVHPVLGYSKMHKGVDFAAKTGTPIYAAGDGVIERANVYGGYGRYIRIRHNSEYKTAYAHLHKFAKNIKRGKSVKQGQIIGYVGSSGRSTGPHLHYEILLNNKQINPQKLKLPEGRKLSQEEFNEFNLIKEAILSNINSYQD